MFLVRFGLLLFLFLPACQPKQGNVVLHTQKFSLDPIFIEMPSNNVNFENVSGLIYEQLVAHFQRIGYKLVDNPSTAYLLRITIKSLGATQKYVSPDILLFHSNVKLILHCQLLNYKNEVITQKEFSFDHLISRPKNPTINSDFLNYEYKRLMLHAAPKIEQHFRKFLIHQPDL